jgi:hypothetical protein
MVIVVHLTASAMSSKDWMSPVQRFPIFGGYKGTSGAGAVGVARTVEERKQANVTSAENLDMATDRSRRRCELSNSEAIEEAQGVVHCSKAGV